ncbi:MAG: sulfite exporter TauE/SafE family protein [Kiritimatiellae bacterium]|nr:sulfite exporter TauE/SafE family protein [Kiritimatiellia bacterium]
MELFFWPALGALMGMLAAFYGAGGGWAVVPLLMWSGRDPVVAVGTSLAVVSVTGAAGLVQHWQLGRVEGRSAAALAIACAVGVELGRRALVWSGRLGVAGEVVQLVLAAVLAAVALRLMVAPHARPGGADGGGALSAALAAALGLPAGVIGGLVGLGGGLILVPALMLGARMHHRDAVALSLAGVAAAGGWGAVRYGMAGQMDWAPAVLLAAGALGGVRVGARACARIVRARFERAFGGLLMLCAVALALERFGIVAARLLLGLILLAMGAMVALESRGTGGQTVRSAANRAGERTSSREA